MTTPTQRLEATSLLAEKMAEKLLEVLDNKYRTCLTCEHFDEKQEGCYLAALERPPARVIAYACPLWQRKIPF